MEVNGTIENILKAMRADDIPAGESGIWKIEKHDYKPWMVDFVAKDQDREVIAGTHTFLRCLSDRSLHDGGEIVMEDTPTELKKHLNFVLKSHGRVLVSGLGLGCVVRGLMKNPHVTLIDVVERSKDVLSLVKPHMAVDERVTIYHADAFEFIRRSRSTWDCAWHDIHTLREDGEPHLCVAHLRLIQELTGRVPYQGAWELPRWVKRRIEVAL